MMASNTYVKHAGKVLAYSVKFLACLATELMQ